MKNILLLSILFILSSCAKENICQDVEYDSSIEIKMGDEICFPDGNAIDFTNVEHQFCPCGVVCIWEGDLYITFTTSNELGETKVKNFYPSRLHLDPSIFSNHEIKSITYKYGTENEEVPECAEDFEPEKLIVTISISMN